MDYFKMGDLSILALETEKILQVIRDSHKKLDIVFEKYNLAVKKNTNLLEEIDFLKKEHQDSEDKNSIIAKMLKDYEERIQKLEKNNLDLKNELKLKSDDLATTQDKYNIKVTNFINIIEEKDEIIKEKEQIIKEKELNENVKKGHLTGIENKKEKEIDVLLAKIKEMEKTILELNEKKSYINPFKNTNELFKSDIKFKIDKTIEKINSLIS
jgi:chromosome segregation ATPase